MELLSKAVSSGCEIVGLVSTNTRSPIVITYEELRADLSASQQRTAGVQVVSLLAGVTCNLAGHYPRITHFPFPRGSSIALEL